MFCIYLLIFLVCDTTYIPNNVTENVANCTTIFQNEIPVRKCEVVEVDTVKYSPNVQCKQDEIDVCGPEPCPLLKGDEVCQDTWEQVDRNLYKITRITINFWIFTRL